MTLVWCTLQYVICFTNMAVMGAFVLQSLCCRPKELKFDRGITVLILMPFLATFLTASVAFYYLMQMNTAQCIYFGSTIAMFAVDIEQQITLIIGIFFINTVQIVLKKTQSLNQSPTDRSTSA